jgi:hypothetical protein
MFVSKQQIKSNIMQVQMFLPRIQDHITLNTLNAVFQKLRIGRIVDADFHRLSKGYLSVHMTVELNLKSVCGKAFLQTLEEKGNTKIVYDEPQFWSVKKIVPKEERNGGIYDICRELMAKPK